MRNPGLYSLLELAGDSNRQPKWKRHIKINSSFSLGGYSPEDPLCFEKRLELHSSPSRAETAGPFQHFGIQESSENDIPEGQTWKKYTSKRKNTPTRRARENGIWNILFFVDIYFQQVCSKGCIICGRSKRLKKYCNLLLFIKTELWKEKFRLDSHFSPVYYFIQLKELLNWILYSKRWVHLWSSFITLFFPVLFFSYQWPYSSPNKAYLDLLMLRRILQ